jgi:hypothetical protein
LRRAVRSEASSNSKYPLETQLETQLETYISVEVAHFLMFFFLTIILPAAASPDYHRKQNEKGRN